MRRLKECSGGKFNINCSCGRKDCDFCFTEDGDIVIMCLCCGNTEIIFKERTKI